MAANIGPTGELCRWVASTGYDDLPPEVRAEAVTLLYDQVGCMIAAATLPACQPVVDLVQQVGGAGECSIVGQPAANFPALRGVGQRDYRPRRRG